MEKILNKITQQIAQKHYHGASLAIYHGGQWETFYLGTIDGISPVSPGLVYDLASVSKVVGVSTILAFWIAEGKLRLDDSLQAHYPRFHEKQVSIRELLTHYSGIDPFIPNRHRLSAKELKVTIDHISVTSDKTFRYTDINFLLLGFMLEEMAEKSLSQLFKERIFRPWQMHETSFGPRKQAVPTIKGIRGGWVHDPKASLLGEHAGSAGLFSTVKDLKMFLEHYLQDEFAASLWENLSPPGHQTRALGWHLDGDWIDHTGYTGPFIMANRQQQQAVIFLTNRTYEKDQRLEWIANREELMSLIKQRLASFSEC